MLFKRGFINNFIFKRKEKDNKLIRDTIKDMNNEISYLKGVIRDLSDINKNLLNIIKDNNSDQQLY